MWEKYISLLIEVWLNFNSVKNWNENNIFVSESTCARLIGSINSYSKQKVFL